MLEKTWELLDYLARPHVAEGFAEKTLSNIQRLELNERLWEPTVAAWTALVGRAVLSFLVGGLFLGLSYAATRWVWPDPTARLVKDLTLAEHLDEYLDVGSFDYLSELAKFREFVDPH
jgi:hypothetical protein